ncbi:putative nicotinate-nucleotide adenylyltransferase [Boseongicola aestuarii]|uniref:Probable nicotinate-nucleotide adenylyltransferase n=1 Tax=Boseongicola aestuarii TaxID=1470561 RepID=A0A238J1P4_9RHOB|nr:putative nicotinate-nucleotide adenylyltransferase [Boseongicola aestuarii]
MARPGRRIGLLGGSFDPPHAGHRHITLEALKRFQLDEVWWLVSPGNPLKERGPAPLEERMTAARLVMDHPRVRITDLETRLGTRYTAATLDALQRRYPGVSFVWLMGADNLARFHRWDRWRTIFETVPLGILARPGDRISARMSPAARQFRSAKLRAREAGVLADCEAPAWCFVNVPMKPISSTALRAARAALATN